MRKVVFCLAVTAIMAASAAPAETPAGLDGVVLAFRTSMVNAKAIGNVSAVAVEEGRKVAQGELLAQLDDTLPRANYELSRLQAEDTTEVEGAKIQLAQAERDIERVKGMGQAAAQVELQKAEYARDLSAKTVKAKELELERSKVLAAARKASLEDYAVRAPFAGIVAQKMIEVGETTAPVERRLFEVIDISKVYIDVHPETPYLESIAVGDGAAVSCELLPGKKFSGKITFVSPSLDTGSRHFGVKVLLENPDELLKPGMKVRVAFQDKARSAAGNTSLPAGSAAAGAKAPPTGTKE